jgi:cysteine desulfurase/selenocysteine lyase
LSVPAAPAQAQTPEGFARFRASFPGANSSTYLDVADRGLISTEVKTAVASFLDACAEGNGKDLARSWIERARQRFAQLVRAEDNEIALVKNVSDGINAVATAIDWKPGDNVVLCEELEHPSNLYPWHNLRDRRGIEIRRVEANDWAIDPERMIAAIDSRTKIVSASMVTFAPGFRPDVAAIGNACRARGVLFLVDAAQAVGVLDVDLRALPVDALAVGTPKALLGLYGMGFLFVRESTAESLRPAYLSGQGIHHDVLDGTPRLKSGAGRFEVGNPNHVGCVAAAVSIAQLQALGMDRVERHARELARMLSDGLKERGLPVLEAPTDRDRTNIVAIGSALEAAIDRTSDAGLRSLYNHLSVRRVRLSIRRGVLRLSTHAYTSRVDIAQTLALVSEWQRAQTGAGRVS